jgi:hypothetical protein
MTRPKPYCQAVSRGLKRYRGDVVYFRIQAVTAGLSLLPGTSETDLGNDAAHTKAMYACVMFPSPTFLPVSWVVFDGR